MEHAYLGPGYSEAQVEAAIERAGLRPVRVEDATGRAAGLLAENKIVGWFNGRMECGPRA